MEDLNKELDLTEKQENQTSEIDESFSKTAEEINSKHTHTEELIQLKTEKNSENNNSDTNNSSKVKLGSIFDNADNDNSKKETISPESNSEIKVTENNNDHVTSDGKAILIMVAALVGIFLISFAGFQAYNHFTSAEVLNIDELHEENLEGELDSEEAYTYNGFSFVEADGLWWTEILVTYGEEKTLIKTPLHFGPRDLTDVIISGEFDSEKFNNGVDVYIPINPDVRNKYYSLALSELNFNIVKGIDRRPIGSCTKESYICEEREIISCENNPDELPVIELVLDLEQESSIEYQGSCIKIIGNGYGIVKAVDRILLSWYGVI